MYILDFIAHIFISPVNQSALGVIVGLLLLKYSRLNKRVAGSLIVISVFWLWLCSQLFFSYWLVAPLERANQSIVLSNAKWQKAEAIWVLACYHFDDDSIPMVSQFNACSLERLVHAANMYRQKPMPIYLTGGKFNERSEISHADHASKLLVQLGVNKDDIVFINTGHDTKQEAAALKEYLNESLIAVVSSATHGIRLHKVLDSLSIDFIFVPVHYSTKGPNRLGFNSPSISALARSESAMYEYAALVKYWIYQ